MLTPMVEPVNLSIDGENLKEVTCFKYLGSNLTSNCILDDEISYRIGQANGTYGSMRVRVFEIHNIALKPKFQCSMPL